jgi:hypothetical protein
MLKREVSPRGRYIIQVKGKRSLCVEAAELPKRSGDNAIVPGNGREENRRP